VPGVWEPAFDMSVDDTGAMRPGSDLEARPDFELECLFDDTTDPTSVTIFYPRGERTVSEWVTADTGTAVSLDDLR
jgi:hypothetical protein